MEQLDLAQPTAVLEVRHQRLPCERATARPIHIDVHEQHHHIVVLNRLHDVGEQLGLKGGCDSSVAVKHSAQPHATSEHNELELVD